MFIYKEKEINYKYAKYSDLGKNNNYNKKRLKIIQTQIQNFLNVKALSQVALENIIQEV